MKYLIPFLFIILPTLSKAQNIGVGTIEPKAKLHVAGQLRTDSSLVLDTIALPAGDFINVPKEAGFIKVTDQFGYQANQMMMNGISKVGQVLFVHNEDDDSVFFHDKIITPRSTSLFINEGMSWLQITDKNASNILSDANGDTRVLVEKRPDEDKIRFEIGGDSVLAIDHNQSGYVQFLPNWNNSSILFGMNAGDSLGESVFNRYGNSVFGQYALNEAIDAEGTTAIGFGSLGWTQSAVYSTSVGASAGAMSKGMENTFFGLQAGYNVKGDNNTWLGHKSGFYANEGSKNTAVGNFNSNIKKGSWNSIVGAYSFFSSDSANYNVAIGSNSGLRANGNYHIFIGDSAGVQNEWSETGNVFIGRKSGSANTAGELNTYFGNLAGEKTSGSSNTFLGYNAGNSNIINGSVIIGKDAGSSTIDILNSTLIGNRSGSRADTIYESNIIGRVPYQSKTTFSQVVGYTNAKSIDSSIILGNNAGFDGNSSIYIGNDIYPTYINIRPRIISNKSVQKLYKPFKSSLESGDKNIFVGNNVGYAEKDSRASIYIGNNIKSLGGSELGFNTFIGHNSQVNSLSERGVAIGAFSGRLANGSEQVIIGFKAGEYAISSKLSVLVGAYAGNSLSGGRKNVIIGNSAGESADSASNSVFIGFQTGYSSKGGEDNVFLGSRSGYHNTTGSQNLFIGTQSGENNTTASNSIALGYRSLYSNETGTSNLAIGTDALFRNLSGSRNIAIGDSAGFNNRSAVGKNIFIGHGAGKNELGKNKLIIENSSSNDALIVGDFKDDYLSFGGSLYSELIRPKVDISYSLGESYYRYTAVYALNGTIQTSDIRQKKNIQNLNYGLNEVMAMRSVSYEWKHDTIGETKVGFIAQELEQIVPEVVVVGDDSLQTRGVNYAELIPVLVNAIQEQQQIITELEEENNLKTADLDAVNNRLSALEQKLDLLVGDLVKE